MGNWFGSKNRGWIFGTWTCHQYLGNIAAAVCASLIIHTTSIHWTWALLLPGICNLLCGLLCLKYLPERPEHVGVETEESAAKALTNNTLTANESIDNLEPISFIDALKIPNVIGYALAFGFFKLINYAIFFWLPYFLASHFTPEQSNLISVLYDIGMMPGGIIVGTISDIYGGRRACVIVTFMMILIPLLWFFALYSADMPASLLLILLGLMGVLVGGPNNIITSAVAADLAEHPSIEGNPKALGTVTGIINGSGSITAALGLMAIGPMQVTYGWTSVWYFLILCTIIGTLLMSPKVYKEIYSHDEVEGMSGGNTRESLREMAPSAAAGGGANRNHVNGYDAIRSNEIKI
jgi:sugar phosphate permease